MVSPVAIPLRLRLLLPALVAASALALLSAIQWMELRSDRSEALEEAAQEVLASGVQLRRDVGRLLRRGEPEGVAEALAWSGVHPLSAGSALIGPDGRVMAGTRAGWVGRPAAEALPPAFLPPVGGEAGRARVWKPSGSDLVVGAFPVRLDSGTPVGETGLLLHGLDAGRPIAQAQADEWRDFRLLTLVTLAGAGLLGLALNRLVSRRADALARAVDRIAAGDLDARPGVGGGDELGRLARGLEAMAGRLADASRTRDRAERLSALQNALLTRTGEAVLGPIAGLHPGDLAPIAFERLSRDLGCDLFFHYEVRDGALRLVAGSGVDEESLRESSRLEFGQELCGEVARLGRPTYLPDVQRSDDPLTATDRVLGVRCYACHPLFSGEELIGTFAVASRTRDRFDEGDLDLIRGASQAIAAAMARLRDAAALRQSEARYRAVVETSPDGILVLEPSGRIVEVNRAYARRSGHPEAELLGKAVADVEATRTPEEVRDHLAAILREGWGRFETVHRTRGGECWPVEVTISAEPDSGRLVAFTRDITGRKRAEAELRRSEERHRLALDGAGLGTWDWHVPSGRTIFDDRWAGMLGYAREEVEPHVSAWERLIHPDDRPAVAAALGPHLDGSSTTYAVEIRLRHKAGHWAWVLATGRVIERDAEGRPARMCGIHLDITERKRAEVALREGEARLRVALEAAGAVAFVWDAEADRSTRYYSTEPALPVNVGRPETLAEVRSRVLPDDREAFDAGMAACVAGGQDYRNVYRVLRPDGSVGWLEEWGHPERDASGRLVRLTGVAIDVTHRKRIEAEILALNADLERRVAERTEDVRKLAAIIDSSTDFIAIASPDGSHLWENRAFREAAGVGPDGLRSRASIGELHPPRSARRILDEGLPAADRDGHWLGETELIAADGRTIPVSQLILSHRGPDGRVEYRSTIMRDITERTRLERTLAERSDQLAVANAQLARASRLKDEFLTSMSHELRTPLNGVLGLSEAMQEGIYGPVSPEQVDALGDVLRSGRHLLSLINDLLDLSRIEAGRMELAPAPSPISDLCEAALRMVRELALRKRQALSMSIRGVDAPAVLDERRVKQILVNLLGNAVKFTPEGGEIGLEVEGDRARKELRFTVRDSGIGIPPGDLEAIFEPFRQLDSRLARSYPGTGLGLALVRRMAQLHGGNVSALSEPGRGSRFTVRLPWILPAEDEPDGPPPAGPAPSPPPGGE